MTKPKTKLSDRVIAAKRRHGAKVNARLKQIAESKRRDDREGGLSREDLEAIRDGRE